ncbi:unnamed protein product [marine sediment metagenome]|uniref:Uncharacterized protein n=1 Tax=marine sediment metagenome TaxID=412755 RepID=X1JRG7_9ZZZZ
MKPEGIEMALGEFALNYRIVFFKSYFRMAHTMFMKLGSKGSFRARYSNGFQLGFGVTSHINHQAGQCIAHLKGFVGKPTAAENQGD